MISPNQLNFFEQEGYLALEDILSVQDMTFYAQTYDAFINNEFDTTDLRSDCPVKKTMTRSTLLKSCFPQFILIYSSPMHQKGLAIAQQLLGKI